MVLITLRHDLDTRWYIMSATIRRRSLLLLLNTHGWRRRKKISRVLHVRHQYRRRVKIKLLASIIAAQREQGRTRTVDCDTSNILQCWYVLKGNVLSSDVP